MARADVSRRGFLRGGLAVVATTGGLVSTRQRHGRASRRSSTATDGGPVRTATSCRSGTSGRSRSSCTTPPPPTRPTSAAERPTGSPALSRTSTWTTADGSTPGSTSRSAAAGSCSRAGTAASRCCETGRRQVEGAHCTGQNVVAVGIENEGTYTAVDPPPALWNRLRDMCAYICNQYDIEPDRDLRPPRLQGHRLPGRPPLRHVAPAAQRGRGRARAARHRAGRDEGVVAAAAAGRPRAGGGGRAVPPARRGHDRGAPTGVFDRTTSDAVRRFQTATARKRSTA